MKKLLIVVDMQNDFITGPLGSKEAQATVAHVKCKISEYSQAGHPVIFTKDTHFEDYLETSEGKALPVVHCIKGTTGHEIIDSLEVENPTVIEKNTFGSLELVNFVENFIDDLHEIELCGVCTDICVVSNALILKAKFPEMKFTVDAKACAGVTVESHKAALLTMKMCHVNVLE